MATGDSSGQNVTAIGFSCAPTPALSDKPRMVVAFYGKFGHRSRVDLQREVKEVNVKFCSSFKPKQVTHIVTRFMADVVKQFNDVRGKELWSLEKWD